MRFSSLCLPVVFVALGCGSAHEADSFAVGESGLAGAASITFDATFHTSVAGALQKGKSARVVYDANRLTACRGEQGGVPQWGITGFYRIAGGEPRTFTVAPSAALLELDRSGDLEIWFQNTNRWGCVAYDSNFGANYHFGVAPGEREPGWMGNVRYAINRATCGGGPCEDTLHPYSGDIVYDTYARQRAAIRVVEFEVWKEGVTDRDDSDLWKKLDVQVHSRVVGTEAFASRYVSFDRRVGNNARYAIDLRDLDSVVGQGTIKDAAKCPSYAISYVPETNQTYVEAPVEFYVTVNEAELRPEGAPTFRVRYQNYADLYVPCVSP